MHPRFHAVSAPDRPAAIDAETGESWSYAELEARANRGAHLLRSLGLRNGDTMAIWLPNILGYFEIYWAAQRAGLYIVPISTQLTAEEAAYILKDSASHVLVTNATIGAAEALLVDVLPEHVSKVLSYGTAMKGVPRWELLVAAFPDTPIADEQAGYHMVYSSGTTGRPKGVHLALSGGPATEPHQLAERLEEQYHLGPESVMLSPAPIYHTAPLAYSTMAQRLGTTVVILRKFDPEAALAAIERYRVTFTQMVPTMFIRLLRLPEEVRRRYDLSSLRSLVHAAAPCPIEIKRQMLEWLGPIIYEYYGGSEGAGSTFITPQEWLEKPGSVGRAAWGVIHVCDEDGRELPAGQPGTIYFSGGWDFHYLNDPEKTRDSRHPEHPEWSTIGDVGYVDGDGYLYLTDRKSFMIISGGVNIYPQEVENLLATHPKVADVAVLGVPSAEMGEEVKAVVQPLDWNDATTAFAEELIAWCRARLSPIKCPRSVDFEHQLPRHETGKLYKRLIRDRYWQGHDRRVA
ncbi:MAG: acyl-CoA synthetase [Sphingomonadaceae bacterium]|nr:acyl-CoA synthetase [Sphingomonadaceae bacterium]